MPDQEKLLQNFEKIIVQHTGVKITKQLQEKLLKYSRENYQKSGFSSELEFSTYLLSQKINDPDIKRLITETTVAESYFFRHPVMLNFLREYWLPDIIKKRRTENNLRLRIWSAGCAGGQELYTISMILLDQIKDIEKWNIHLIGTDIDASAIAQARSGRYGEWSFRGGAVPPEKYFVKDKFHFEVRQPLKSLTKFFYLNLIDNSYPSIANGTNNMDLILCCNVIIYLTDENVKKLLNQFFACLNDEGILLFSPSDFVREVPQALDQVQSHGVTLYRKHIVNSDLDSENETLEELDSKKIKYESLLPILFKQLNQEEWQGALTTIERCVSIKGETALLLQFKSNALANLGELNQALKICNKSIDKDANDPHSYLIKAMILLGLGHPHKAESAFRQALLLNSDFVEVQFHLGSLLIRLGRWSEGVALLRSAAELIKRFDPERKVHHAPRLTFAEFEKIIENEISAYENARSKLE